MHNYHRTSKLYYRLKFSALGQWWYITTVTYHNFSVNIPYLS